jgi:hypothetical protein
VVLDNGFFRLYKPYTFYFGEPLCMECYKSEVGKADFDKYINVVFSKEMD